MRGTIPCSLVNDTVSFRRLLENVMPFYLVILYFVKSTIIIKKNKSTRRGRNTKNKNGKENNKKNYREIHVSLDKKKRLQKKNGTLNVLATKRWVNVKINCS